jgi:hypothetical protein
MVVSVSYVWDERGVCAAVQPYEAFVTRSRDRPVLTKNEFSVGNRTGVTAELP